MAGVFEVMARQRACRRFDERPVPTSVLRRLLEAATWAPSAENAQPWHFVVLRRPESRRALVGLARRAWDAGGRRHAEGRLAQAVLDDVEQAVGGGLERAPIQVVVCADHRRVRPSVASASVFPAIQNLLLAATACGLGSVLTTLPLAFEDEVRELLGLPEGVVPVAVVPLGWPARPLGPPRRRPLTEVVHEEAFGQPLEGAEEP